MGLDKDSKIVIGTIKKGKRNLITDVKGVKVGHITLNDGSIKTGVTAILPHGGNIFKEKVMASSCVINGDIGRDKIPFDVFSLTGKSPSM